MPVAPLSCSFPFDSIVQTELLEGYIVTDASHLLLTGLWTPFGQNSERFPQHRLIATVLRLASVLPQVYGSNIYLPSWYAILALSKREIIPYTRPFWPHSDSAITDLVPLPLGLNQPVTHIPMLRSCNSSSNTWIGLIRCQNAWQTVSRHEWWLYDFVCIRIAIRPKIRLCTYVCYTSCAVYGRRLAS